jgi:hypothetical protein
MLHTFSTNLVKIKKFDQHISRNVIRSGMEGVSIRHRFSGSASEMSGRLDVQPTLILTAPLSVWLITEQQQLKSAHSADN